MDCRNYLLRVLGLGLVLSIAPACVRARPFYNPRRYHTTRQTLTNRTITSHLGRKPGRKPATKPAPKRSDTPAPKTKPAPTQKKP